MKINVKKFLKTLLVISSIFVLNFALVPGAFAASLTTLSDTLSRQLTSTASNHSIKFTTPTGVTAGQNMTVTFPAGFTIGSVTYTDIDVLDGAGQLTLGSAAAGATWGASFTGQVLTISSGSGTIAAGHVITINIGDNAVNQSTGVNKITNPASANTYVVTVGGSMADSGTFAVVVVSNVTGDQVSMTANVDPSITFSLSANSSPFGTITTGAIKTSSPNITLTVGTNANTGYTITVQDQGNGTVGGLYNSGASYNIGSATALLSAGNEGYGIQATQTGGATIVGPYTASGNNVGQLQRTPQNLATYGSPTTSNHTVTVSHLAAVSASTKAGSYSDTITYIATGNF